MVVPFLISVLYKIYCINLQHGTVMPTGDCFPTSKMQDPQFGLEHVCMCVWFFTCSLRSMWVSSRVFTVPTIVENHVNKWTRYTKPHQCVNVCVFMVSSNGRTFWIQCVFQPHTKSSQERPRIHCPPYED